MTEGWQGDDYLVLFDADEAVQKQSAYKVDARLPGCAVLGLIGWDDFLVRDTAGRLYRVPTVPLIPSAKKECAIQMDEKTLRPDVRFVGKIKWYRQPLVFGGHPGPGENIVWVPHNAHVDLVNYWNDIYSRVAKNP